MSEFGERLKKAREAKGYTQIELAQIMGLTQASISQFEKGLRLPTSANIKKIAEELDVTEESLAGENEGEFEKAILMRNLTYLSPNDIRKINEIINMIKGKDSIDERK